ncbi:MAG: tRNA pseudouridine(38-40) synthase TruA [Acidobacteria bacterium]|nr:MAG: tRNA pseudouridine(38-40) synthase TruA [Acidobacteriota bacterium]
MGRWRITLAYDGTDFAGWQVQRGARPPSPRTVQGTLEAALGRLADGARVSVVAAGRTDTGVHALGQVASFTLAREMTAHDLQRALNALLPADVRVLEVGPAPPDFHARTSAQSKLYRYELDSGPVQLPTRRRLAGHVPWVLDQPAVRAAAELYRGRHDFASLASAGGSARTTVRTVLRSEALFANGTLIYEVEADGFLRRMVRSLVGGLIAVGRGTLAIDDLRRALLARDRRAWPPPADARGLTLVRVAYPSSPM